jgi:signal transduction histidine kinase
MLDRIQTLVDGMEQTVDGIAHDTRTPLSRIRIEAEQALAAAAEREQHSGDSREAARAGLERILDEVAGLQQMLQGVFDLRAMEAGSLKPGMQVTSLGELLVPLLESAQMVCEESGLELTLDQDAESLASPVRVDLHRARQAISNVLDNAMSYAHSTVLVRLSSTGSDSVGLVVENDGELPAPGELAELWRLRYRGQNSRSKSGLGIGLPFVQAVSRLHGWDAALGVSEGRFRLTLTLPICKDPESYR